MSNRPPVEIETRSLEKSFGALKVLQGVDFMVRHHQVVALIGPSGSGKSTFLRCLNLLEFPDSGDILWKGDPVDYRRMRPGELSRHRRKMGMVFQHFHLFPHRNVLENVVEGPVQVLGIPARKAREQGMELLEKVGLEVKADAWPAQLSGGQKQRVAIARALAHSPRLILADEPTGNLDSASGKDVLDLLRGVSAQRGCAVLMATHSREASEWGDQVIMMRDGQVNGIYPTRG
jgi:ABC-type polar amino acid transport system ATPase subunit